MKILLEQIIGQKTKVIIDIDLVSDSELRSIVNKAVKENVNITITIRKEKIDSKEVLIKTISKEAGNLLTLQFID